MVTLPSPADGWLLWKVLLLVAIQLGAAVAASCHAPVNFCKRNVNSGYYVEVDVVYTENRKSLRCSSLRVLGIGSRLDTSRLQCGSVKAAGQCEAMWRGLILFWAVTGSRLAD